MVVRDGSPSFSRKGLAFTQLCRCCYPSPGYFEEHPHSFTIATVTSPAPIFTNNKQLLVLTITLMIEAIDC